MRRSYGILTLNLMLIVLLTAGCSKPVVNEMPTEKARLVKVQEVKEDALPVRLKYTGITSAGEIKKYGFKVPGRVSEINVVKGNPIHSGQKLAAVSTKELMLGVQASEYNVQKAEKAYLDARDTYLKLEKLFQAGALPQMDLNKAKLDLDVKEASYNQARIDLESKQILLKDATLYSDMEGYVVDVLNKEGEIIAAGYPVLVVRAGDQKVTVGLSQNDVKKVKVGTVVHIELDGLTTKGEVSRIDAVPDTQSRTYNTEILLSKPLPEDKFYLGATAQVEFELGEAKGIWIPLASVLNDGEDYIFIVKENRAIKKNIKLVNVQGFNVRVEGLEPGEQLVTMGMKVLKEGTKVQLQSEGESK
jgi:RND family efflux transporter MFP subunit